MKTIRHSLPLFALAALFPIAVFAHNGIDHSKEHSGGMPIGHTIESAIFAAGFATFGGLVLRDKRKQKLAQRTQG